MGRKGVIIGAVAAVGAGVLLASAATGAVVELSTVSGNTKSLIYELRVTNAGPAVARDVSVELVKWTDEATGSSIDRVDVAPALLRGEQRPVTLTLPRSDAHFDERSEAIEVRADYYDDNGVRDERLASVYEDDLVLTPPQPPRELPLPSAKQLRRG